MRGLILRLSQIDSSAEAAMRVVAYFDALVQGGATLEAVLRSTASLTGTSAGFVDAVTGEVLLGGSPAEPDAPTLGSDVQVAGTVVGRVWIVRGFPEGDLDELVVERLALSVSGLWPTYGRWLPSDAWTLLRTDATSEAREGARHRLRMGPTDRCVAVAVTGGDARQAQVSDALRAAIAPGSRVEALVADGPDLLALVRGEVDVACVGERLGPLGTSTGSATATTPAMLPRARHQAQAAARLARAAPGLLGAAVSAEDLGALTRLVDVPVHTLEDDADVRALLAIVDAGRDEDLDLLEAFLAAGTLRGAGGRMHRHHSSVAARLERLQRDVGFDLDAPLGRPRAVAALLLARLAQAEAAEHRHASS